MDEYEAIVFDLDNTLVRLDVEWNVVADDVALALRDRGIDPPDSLWKMLDVADRTGTREVVEAIISTHEREGARRSERLPAADEMPDRPTAVCSLNAESACRLALQRHELADRIDAVVGRDTLSTRKPDPEPLLHSIDALEASPERTLFVGDGQRDERTAERADVAFVYVSEFLRA